MNKYLETQTFTVADVVGVNDPDGTGEIQVRLRSDQNIPDEMLVSAFPLLPKHLAIMPELGEAVIVFVMPSRGNQRFWVGPIISTKDKLNRDPSISATAPLNNSIMPKIRKAYGSYNPETNPDAKGVYNKPDEVGLLGRGNTDVLLKDNEVWIRAGRYEVKDGNIKVFSHHPAFLQIKNYEKELTRDNNSFNSTRKLPTYTRQDNGQEVEYKTVTNLVSDEINLISSSGNRNLPFRVSDPENMIKDGDVKNILETAHYVGYGDTIMKLLDMIVDILVNHNHNGSQNKTTYDDALKALLKYKRETKFVSNNIRIN
jgi:hypothetical protein